MPAPLGYNRRHDRGLRGMLARWWLNHRRRQIHRARRRR